MEQFNDTDVKSLSFKGRLEMHDWKMTDPQLWRSNFMNFIIILNF